MERLNTLDGRAKFEFYVDTLHRSKRFHETYSDFNPVDFQYKDWLSMDKEKEACYVRACGGSKTFDTGLWLILRLIMNRYEKWAWLAAASGQLLQAREFFNDNPFVSHISGSKGEEFINLINGSRILFRGTTKSITGVRLDGIVLDEEEMLEPNQVEIVYPQLHGRMTHSKVGKFFHLGTMQYATLFMTNIEKYPSYIHDWTECPWLTKEPSQIQGYIDAGIMPEFEINMLYRCIPSVPGGLFFHNIKVIDNYKFDVDLVDYGLDFNATDMAVGVIIDGDICTIVDEIEVDLEANHTALDILKGHNIGAEGGLYNDDIRFSAKCQLVVKRINATRVMPTNKWKKIRKMHARGFTEIRIIKQNCRKTLTDMQGCMFGPDGLWLKDKKHPVHWVDAFMMAIGSGLRHKIYGVKKHEPETDRFRLISKLKKAGKSTGFTIHV